MEHAQHYGALGEVAPETTSRRDSLCGYATTWGPGLELRHLVHRAETGRDKKKST